MKAANLTCSTASSMMATTTATTALMRLCKIGKAGIAHPFGDERSVTQAFPSGINEKEADPFLMCDFFSSTESSGPSNNPDHFPVDWHPHRGFDICTYLKTGKGRHADSLGNRGTFETPGMQWMSTGSGVYHAEGGGSTKGERITGFQIWVNVPSQHKMDDPRYGTVPPSGLPLWKDISPGVNVRSLAGPGFGSGSVQGPFQTVQPVQMMDFEFQKGPSTIAFDIQPGLDTAMVYVYEGIVELSTPNTVGGSGRDGNHVSTTLVTGSIAVLDASSDDARGIQLSMSGGASAQQGGGAGALLFAGKKLNQPIAWHGPIVMTTQEEIHQTLRELRSGRFPPKKVDWDYRRLAANPNAKA